MRKSYTFGIPFGLQRESGLFLDITEVSRGIDCNCICPACKTDLLAKQGEVKLWHFSHSTAVAGDCDGLMEAIRGKIIEVINEHQVLGFPNLLAGDDGGLVSLNEVSGSGSMFGGTADLFVKVNDLCVAVFLDRDRSISEKLTFDHLHPSERVAALRIDLPDIEYEISQVQLGRRKTTYSECIESLIIDETSSREWLYHPLMHELESEPLQEYRGREPSEEGPLLQRLADCKMNLPDILPGSHNALVRLQQDTIVCLCRLTVRAYDIAQTDEFPLFLRYFRLHCLENSEHVSYERLICWQEMISKTQEGQSLTQNELEYLHEIVRIAFYNHRLNNVSISDVKNHDTGKKSGRVESQNYSLL